MNNKDINDFLCFNNEFDIYIDDIQKIVNGSMTLEEAIERKKDDQISNLEDSKLFYKVTKYILETNNTSILNIQKQFSIGFSKANSIVKLLGATDKC